MKSFSEIRIQVLREWYSGLKRHRSAGDFSDDYSGSPWCDIQNECADRNEHCSFICSLNDWLDNISDLLHDDRFDRLNQEDYEVLFRYYTRILLLVSEVIEDFVMLNKQVLNLPNKKDSSRDLENGIFMTDELKDLSEFINTVCKHKAERDNLHVHNHHLVVEFVDFGAIEHENQIRLNNQDWSTINQNTTILMPSLKYFTELVRKTNDQVLNYVNSRSGYKMDMLKLYSDQWEDDEE